VDIYLPKRDAPNPRFQTLPKTTTFADFLEGKPDGILYELHDRVIVEIQPIGEHEEINGFASKKLNVQFDRLNLPYINFGCAGRISNPRFRSRV
jgi:Uma2 family endonuclease